MADAKLTSLSAATAVTADDLLYVVDDPAGTPTSKKVTAAVLREFTSLKTTAASVTTADVTGVVGTLHYLDLSGLTAARNLTLPAVAAVDDRVGVYVSAGCTTAGRELILKADTGDTLNGVSAAEWSRVFITGECVIMRCVVANTTWVVDYDGRIPCYARIEAGSSQSLANGSFTSMTLGTVAANIGSLTATANTITIRRAGTKYKLYGGGAATGGSALTTLIWSVYKGGAEYRRVFRGLTDNVGGGGSTGGGGAVLPSVLAASDALTLSGFVNTASCSSEYIATTSVAFLAVEETF